MVCSLSELQQWKYTVCFHSLYTNYSYLCIDLLTHFTFQCFHDWTSPKAGFPSTILWRFPTCLHRKEVHLLERSSPTKPTVNKTVPAVHTWHPNIELAELKKELCIFDSYSPGTLGRGDCCQRRYNQWFILRVTFPPAL